MALRKSKQFLKSLKSVVLLLRIFTSLVQLRSFYIYICKALWKKMHTLLILIIILSIPYLIANRTLALKPVKELAC